MWLTHSGPSIKSALLPFSLTLRASYTPHKKISAATLHWYLPFEQTAIIKFEKNSRFDDLSPNVICCYKKIPLQISKSEASPPLRNTKQPRSLSQKERASEGVVLTVWRRMKGHPWEGLKNKSLEFSYLLNSCCYVLATFPRTRKALNKMVKWQFPQS